MALSNSLFTGVSGLQTSQAFLNTVGNNLANSNTPGFKGQSINFQDLFYQTLLQGSSSSGTVGGTNPSQQGFGAAVGSIATNFQQGPLQTTGNDLDLALQGSGFFIVRDGTQNLYTRAGTFQLDQSGFVVASATGFLVQRFG